MVPDTQRVPLKGMLSISAIGEHGVFVYIALRKSSNENCNPLSRQICIPQKEMGSLGP